MGKPHGRTYTVQPAPYGLPTPCLIHPNKPLKRKGGNGPVLLCVKNPEGGRQIYAHRLAYIEAYGPIPEGLIVRHKCDVRNCVNPDHLELGTVQDNSNDMVERKRSLHRVGIKGPTAKLTTKEALMILAMPGRHADIARKFGVCRSTVSYIKTGKLWPHLQRVTYVKVGV